MDQAQLFANEVAKDEEIIFVENQKHEFVSQTDAFEASRILQELLDKQNADSSS